MEKSGKNDSRWTKKVFFGLFLALSDLIFLMASFYLAYYLRFISEIFGEYETAYLIRDNYIFYFKAFLVSSFVIFFFFKLYNWDRIYKNPSQYLKVSGSIGLSIIAIVVFGYFYGSFYFSRIWVLLLFLIGSFSVAVIRYIIIRVCKIIFKIPKESFTDEIKQELEVIEKFTRAKKKILAGLMLVINDIIFLAASFYLAYYLRFYTRIFSESILAYTLDNNYVFYSIIFIVSALIIFYLSKLYNLDAIYRGSGYYYRIVRSFIIDIVIIIVIGYLFERFTFSRIWISLLIVIGILLLTLSRFIIEICSQKILKKFDVLSKTMIIGIGENGRRIENTFKKQSLWGYKIAGYVDTMKNIKKNKEYSDSFLILGYLENIKEVIKRNNVQSIIISGLEYKYFELLDILEKLKSFDISIVVFPGFFEFSVKRMRMREISGIPLMQIANIGFFGINLFLKNVTDYVLGSIIFLFFIPIYLSVGIMIKINSTGPIFFKQKRYTKDCREFYMYKFRTMYVDAEGRLEELRRQNEASGPIFKIKDDPRITRIGRFLRKFSIDELPQIINVLKGELSLVGPRPPIPAEVKKYDKWVRKRLNVKQGITGLWQISGRSLLDFEEMARLDLYYIQNWSIGMDINIILKTIPAVLFSRGAY